MDIFIKGLTLPDGIVTSCQSETICELTENLTHQSSLHCQLQLLPTIDCFHSGPMLR